jgi:methyl-accepting chemotaxis protein
MKKIKFTKSIRFKILIQMVIILLIGNVLLVGISALRFSSRIYEDTENRLRDIGIRYAQEVAIDLRGKLDSATALAPVFENIMESGNPSREDTTELMLKIFDRYTNSQSMWLVFGENDFDGRDDEYNGTPGYIDSGIYGPYMWRVDGKIEYVDEGYDYYVNEPYYTLSRDTNTSVILDPYVDTVSGHGFLMASMVANLKPNGVFKGTVGVDILITPIHEKLKQVNPYETGYLVLISENGIVSSSPNDDDLGLLIDDSQIDPKIIASLKEAQETKKEVDDEYDLDGKKAHIKAFSLDQGIPGGNWALAVIAFDDAIIGDVTDNNILSGGIATAVIVFSVIWIFVTLSRMTNPVTKMAEVADKLAKGNMNVELPKHKAKDEIFFLRESFSRLIKSNKDKVKAVDQLAHGDLENIHLDAGKEDELANSIIKVSDTLKEFSNRIQDTSANITLGFFKERIQADDLEGKYQELAEDVNMMAGSIVNRIDNLPVPLLAIAPDHKVRYVNKAVSSVTGISQADSVGKNCYDMGKFDACKDGNGSCACNLAMEQNKVVNDQTKTTLPDGTEFHMQYSGTPIQDKDGKVVGVIETAMDVSEQENEKVRLKKRADYQNQNVQQLLSNIEELSNGSFNMSYPEFAYDEDTKDIFELYRNINSNFAKSINLISGYVNEISKVLNQLSNSNLDVEVSGQYVGEFGSIKDALNTIITSFNEVVKNIYHSSTDVSKGASAMSESSTSLSSGSTEQAASIEEISATVTQVAAQVRETAQNSEQVNLAAKESMSAAEQSDQYMQHLTKSMKEVQKSTANIQKVLKMINDIAFQTNILSLNAAVEAARAGQHGKGFAVIAEDVRNLALKSANAADETTDMLDSIVAQINDSVSYANQTADSLHKIVEGAEASVRISNEVANASNEQSEAVGQITLSLDQISQVVQVTSVNAQQGAQISQELISQSKQLMEIVSKFNIKDFKQEILTFKEQEKPKQEKVKDEVVINLDDELF